MNRYHWIKRKGGIAPFLLAGVLASLMACAGTADDVAAAGPARVLFVGNSFTYYNNSLHNHYRQLVESAGRHKNVPSRVRALTISGGHLPEHASGLRQRLENEDWDVVVLQGHSLGPIDDQKSHGFRQSAREYVRLVRQDGAEPVFFMTWAYTGKPEMTSQLDTAYSAIGHELRARVVPVGLAFETVTAERPAIALRISDARHPTLAGTYLAACTFYAVLHAESPEKLRYTAGLDEEVAAYLQSVAWRVTQEYEARWHQ